MLRLYFAAPLFSAPERKFNEELVTVLSECFDVYLPQRDGALMVNLIAAGSSPEAARLFVFNADIEAIKDCDVLLAVLDGPAVDDGVSFEIGVAFTLSKPCIGLSTDFRRNDEFFNNPMWRESLLEVFRDKETLLKWARHYTSLPGDLSLGITNGRSSKIL